MQLRLSRIATTPTRQSQDSSQITEAHCCASNSVPHRIEVYQRSDAAISAIAANRWQDKQGLQTQLISCRCKPQHRTSKAIESYQMAVSLQTALPAAACLW